ncbi:MAG: adenylyltransferase/cytidyltransferase family protein [Candidatus Micrarchaeota archaeon]|nr:adenylyltransferase/cytidyltransferase family protein [Candidatus Micrarchaeota archaeon]
MAIGHREKRAGLLIGRFQPFHNGHLEMVNQSTQNVDVLYIVVGSINKKDEKNPFSALERKMMILNSVSNEVASKLKILFVPDFNNDPKWMECIDYLVPKYDVIYSSDDEMSLLLRRMGKKVEEIKQIDRKILSGTKMRQMLFEGKDISKHLPSGTRGVIAMSSDSALMALLQKRG